MTTTETRLASEPAVTLRRGRTILFSVLAGFALTVLWSAPFVDRVIGDGVTSPDLSRS